MSWLYAFLFQLAMVKVFCEKVPYPLVYSISLYPNVSEGLPSNSLFGYSAAFQPKMQKFVISAPNSDKYGSTFTCDAESRECVRNEIPKFGGKNNPDHGSYYWGATIIATSDFYMSCAPRACYHPKEYDVTEARCYYKHYEEEDLKIIPILPRNNITSDLQRQVDINNGDRWGSFTIEYLKMLKNGSRLFPKEFYFTSFGWSMDITNDNTVLVGGPAGFSGRVILYNDIKKEPQLLKLDNTEFEKSNGSVLFNFGYSITHGKFFNDSTQYAISTTYGDIGEGKVLLFDDVGSYMYKTIVDEGHIGSMFGASLASAKLDGNSTYLLVGSPTYSQSISSGDAQLGAVRIYKPEGDNFLLHNSIIGFESEGYFGLKLTRITDVNNDNIDDVVISAPYENEGRGSIYIYSGADLISSASAAKYLQKVEGSAPSGYFGLSVALVEDYDENGCNELAVGEPGSNLIKILRCISTVDVDLTAKFPDLKVESDLVRNDGTDNFFYFRPCIYIKHPEKPVNISTQIMVNTTLNHPHATILENAYYIENYSFSIEEHCGMVKIKLPKEGNYDKPLRLDVKVSTKDQSETEVYEKHKVTLSGASNTSLSGIVWGHRSELKLLVNTTMTNGYIIGSTDTEMINVTVINLKDIPAHKPCVHINVIGASIMIASDTCKSTKQTLTCTPAGILYKGTTFQITLDTKKIESSLESLTIKAYLVNDCETSVLRDEPDYKKDIEIRLAKDIRGSITGESLPSSEMRMTESDLVAGQQFMKHMYKINNEGNTTWTNVYCDIKLPPYVTAEVHLDTEPCYTQEKAAICTISKLSKNNTVIVSVTIMIPSGSNMKTLSNGNITTSLTLRLEDHPSKSVTTTIILEDTRVPIWIIAVAIVLGLIILVIIFYIFRECGCFRRKNKEKLQELKKEVKRQSIRRSMHESMPPNMDFRQDLEDRLRLISSRENLSCEEQDKHQSPQLRKPDSIKDTTQAEIH